MDSGLKEWVADLLMCRSNGNVKGYKDIKRNIDKVIHRDNPAEKAEVYRKAKAYIQ